MPSFSSPGAVAFTLKKLGKELETEDALRITREQAERGQQIAEREASRDLGGDPEFSGWEGRLDTQILEARRGAGHILAPATTLSAAQWTTVEAGRHADGGIGRFQGPGVNMKTGRTGRNKKTGKIIIRGRRAAVQWNGTTKGKHTATRAVALMRKDVDEIAERGVERALRRHFDL